MYRGKRIAPISKNKRNCITLALSVILLVSTLAIRPTVAYLLDTTNEVENTFQYGWVSCAVDETIDGTAKKDVTIQNTGNTSAYIRATIVVTWKDENGNVYGPVQPIFDTDYTLTINSNDWFVGSDGYYYYTNSVADNSSTGVLIESCTRTTTTPPTDSNGASYELAVEILADAIQSSPNEAVESAWPVQVDADGMLSEVTS